MARTKEQQKAFDECKRIAQSGTEEEQTALANALLIQKLKLRPLPLSLCLLVFELFESDKK